jgi:hypothetical protein
MDFERSGRLDVEVMKALTRSFPDIEEIVALSCVTVASALSVWCEFTALRTLAIAGAPLVDKHLTLLATQFTALSSLTLSHTKGLNAELLAPVVERGCAVCWDH